MLTILTLRNVKYIFKIIKEFERLSGLEVNINKTSITPLNSECHNIILDLEKIGLKITHDFKVLGFKIDKKLEFLSQNWEDAILKIKKQVIFWKKHHLTLKGRIRIAKTFLLSQVTHLGTILTPSPHQTEIMSSILFDFIAGKDNVAKTLYNKPGTERGLGFFDLDQFLKGLKIGLISRCKKYKNDDWKIILTDNKSLDNLGRDQSLKVTMGPLRTALFEFCFNYYKKRAHGNSQPFLENPLRMV